MYIVLKNRMPHSLIKKECESGMWGGILRNIGTIFVQREDKKSCEEAISVLIHNLVHGEDVVIFPEGTRNRTQQLLLPLKKGLYMFHKFLKNRLFQLQLRNMEENM